MREYLLYLTARLAILLIALALVWAIAGYNLVALIAGVVISSMVSYLALAGLRNRATHAMIERAENKARLRAQRGPKQGSDEAYEDSKLDGHTGKNDNR